MKTESEDDEIFVLKDGKLIVEDVGGNERAANDNVNEHQNEEAKQVHNHTQNERNNNEKNQHQKNRLMTSKKEY